MASRSILSIMRGAEACRSPVTSVNSGSVASLAITIGAHLNNSATSGSCNVY